MTAALKQIVSQRMTEQRARRVRELRCDEGYTWRAVAHQTHEDWGGGADLWKDPANQIAGMVLCEAAAAMLGEDASAEPWN
jgi:hypothetical protein